MAVKSGRWNEISKTEFAHEREAFEHLRETLGDEVLQAWTNLEFFTDQGHIYEVDLLILTLHGFFLVEVKSWRGQVGGDQSVWTLDGGATTRNPLLLANKKAKLLASLLGSKGEFKRDRLRVPFLQTALYLSHTSQPPNLPLAMAQHVFVRGEEAKFFGRPGRETISLTIERATVKVMEEIGLVRKPKDLMAGSFRIGQLLSEDAATQDYLGTHQFDPDDRVRIRVYPLPAKASQEDQLRSSRAANREYKLLRRTDHPALERPRDIVVTPIGPALIYDYSADDLPLDQFLQEKGERLDLWARLRLIRDIAEGLAAAQELHLVHRALAPQSITITPDGDRVRLTHWQTGMKTDGAAQGTSHLTELVADPVSAYIAPETWRDPSSAGTYSDVFSLGAIAYTVLTDRPPAEDQAALRTLIEGAQGLRLSAIQDAVVPELDDLIASCTHPKAEERPMMAEDFLSELSRVEEVLRRPEALLHELADPLKAQAGEVLPNGEVLVKRLGSGAVSVALLVEGESGTSVLKVARDAAAEDRLAEEAEVLEKLSHPNIVSFRERVSLGLRTALRLEFVEEQNLATYLAVSGPLQPEMLERYGNDLLKAVAYLEKIGLPHRDIKPSNMGTTLGTAKKERYLVLYDFSLSRVGSEVLRAGTAPYLDPFLGSGGRHRWDTAAERYAVAMTLYEMATRTLPVWGDGSSDPSADLNATLDLSPSLFDPHLRPGLTAFFERALGRDAAARFDNAELMREAWKSLFATQSASVHPTGGVAPSNATYETRLAELGLSPAALAAVENLEVTNVEQFLGLSRPVLYTGKGLGKNTRKELQDLREQLERANASQSTSDGAALSGLDVLLKSILSDKEAGKGDTPEVRLAWLDGAPMEELIGLFKTKPKAKAESNAKDVVKRKAKAKDPTKANAKDVAKAKALYSIQSALRTRWRALGALREVRKAVPALLKNLGWLATDNELAGGLLSRFGSTLSSESERLLLARRVLAAATAAEGEDDPGWMAAQVDGRTLLTVLPAAFAFAGRLARKADEIVVAATGPLAPLSAETQLSESSSPEGLVLEGARLVKLAAELSKRAALSSRGELYPRGMQAEVALKSAAGVFLATSQISVVDLKRRVRLRYPEAAELPGRPKLDQLLSEANIPLIWDEGEARYLRKDLAGTGATGSSSYYSLSNDATDEKSLSLAARHFEERLKRGQKKGGFLVLPVSWKYSRIAEQTLRKRRPELKTFHLDRTLITSMRDFCAQKKVDWQVVLAADAGPHHEHWGRLVKVFEAALVPVRETLLHGEEPLLITNAGLLARYGGMSLLEELRDTIGTPGYRKSAWLLLPSVNPSGRPTLCGHPIPILSIGDQAEVPSAWLLAPDDSLVQTMN